MSISTLYSPVGVNVRHVPWSTLVTSGKTYADNAEFAPLTAREHRIIQAWERVHG